MQITDQVKIDEYYQALLDKNPSYSGAFFVAVKTTSIFCIATCRARKPKKKNVVFYSGCKDALDAGFRPCKVCKPTENAFEAPAQVQQALALVRQDEKMKVTDYQLKCQGIQPEFVRRWFNKHYGMTFQAYQRMFRINNAFQELKAGKKTLETAYDNGYDSLSGFNYTFKKATGKSPRESDRKNVILLERITSKLGPMFVAATEKGVCMLEFVDRRMLETEFHDLQKRLDATILIGENKHIKQLKMELEEYFEGTRQTFTVSLDTPGTEFQQQVWQQLQAIPYGQLRSYQQQAVAINNEKAVRAVANANGMNRVAIIIPCHRVIGKDGSLTGYGGGLERKEWLLRHEGAI